MSDEKKGEEAFFKEGVLRKGRAKTGERAAQAEVKPERGDKNKTEDVSPGGKISGA